MILAELRLIELDLIEEVNSQENELHPINQWTQLTSY